MKKRTHNLGDNTVNKSNFIGIFLWTQIIYVFVYFSLYLFIFWHPWRLVVQTRVHNQRVEYKLSDNDSLSRWDIAHQLMDNAEALRSQRLRIFWLVFLFSISCSEYSDINTLNMLKFWQSKAEWKILLSK